MDLTGRETNAKQRKEVRKEREREREREMEGLILPLRAVETDEG